LRNLHSLRVLSEQLSFAHKRKAALLFPPVPVVLLSLLSDEGFLTQSGDTGSELTLLLQIASAQSLMLTPIILLILPTKQPNVCAGAWKEENQRNDGFFFLVAVLA